MMLKRISALFPAILTVLSLSLAVNASAGTDGRKVVYKSLNPVDLVRNANVFTYAVIAIAVILVAVIVLIVRAVVKKSKKKKAA